MDPSAIAETGSNLWALATAGGAGGLIVAVGGVVTKLLLGTRKENRATFVETNEEWKKIAVDAREDARQARDNHHELSATVNVLSEQVADCQEKHRECEDKHEQISRELAAVKSQVCAVETKVANGSH